MPADPWFRAEHRPALVPRQPIVLRRGGDFLASATYYLSVADAVALRDSLTAAILAAQQENDDAR